MTVAESPYRWVIVALGGLMGCVSIGAMFSLAVFLAPMSDATQWSRAGISAAMTINFLVLAFGSFGWGAASDRWGARISWAYRDDYLTTVPGRNNNDVEGTNGTLNVDFSANYRFSDRLEFTLEALNLTDEFSDQWVSSVADRSSVYHHTGRQYFVGVRFRF